VVRESRDNYENKMVRFRHTHFDNPETLKSRIPDHKGSGLRDGQLTIRIDSDYAQQVAAAGG